MPVEPEIQWVDTPDTLSHACDELAKASYLAMDTEFIRESSFHPIPALIQLTGGGKVYLIDPQALEASDAVRHLLGQEGPVKLLHACSEDLEVLSKWSGVIVQPIIDTQLAQGMLGETPSMGYQRLVEHWTGDVLPKDETRSDWLERPLSEAQCRYAALDVVYLLPIWQLQRQALETKGRLAWLQADCDELVSQAQRSAENDGEWYRRHRQLWRLDPRSIAAYQRLTAWREGEVRHRDMPRNWLVSDKVLFSIAEALPANRYELSQVEGVKPSLIKREGDALLAILRDVIHLEPEQLPAALPSPMSGAFKRRLKALKGCVSEAAERLGVAPELLARRRDLEALVVADLEQLPLPLPDGWRGDLLVEPFEKALGALATEAERN
ncbi:ribonuclease D [Modicisalibacter luteus]|uniref:Ribonuclease D n=1 Tax=Modicisalibacter luteus TaxID=453962 RepID=A0ABV7M5J8_9GAMM|nr:ribonuclease D [Halomonas lutea]GHB12222.1 ribonuclease D [Halomonas lutea]